MNYKIPFWSVFSVILATLSVLIWLSVLKSTDNKMIQTGALGIRFVVEQYLRLSLLRGVIAILRNDRSKVKKEVDIRLSVHQEKWITHCSPVLTRHILSFVRGTEVMMEMIQEIRNPSVKGINLFVLPDVLLQRSGINYYHDILMLASKIAFNENALYAEYSNDESKDYLIALVEKSRKHTKPTPPMTQIQYFE